MPLTKDAIKAKFTVFDEQGIGMIKSVDFPNLIRACGLCPSKKDIQDLLKQLDPKNSGTLDFESVAKVIIANESKFAIQHADLTNALKALDKEGLGKVSQQELFNLLHSSGEIVTSEELNLALDGYVLDGQELDIESFAKHLLNYKFTIPHDLKEEREKYTITEEIRREITEYKRQQK